jgi:hypothetical protein
MRSSCLVGTYAGWCECAALLEMHQVMCGQGAHSGEQHCRLSRRAEVTHVTIEPGALRLLHLCGAVPIAAAD